MASSTNSGQGSTSESPGWYLVDLADGIIDLVRHTGNGPINTGQSSKIVDAQQVGNDPTQPASSISNGAQIGTLLKDWGATAAQTSTLIGQLDTGVAKNSSLKNLLVSPGGQIVNANNGQGGKLSTAKTGDANSAGVNISGVTDPVTGIFNTLMGDAKYAAIWVGLVVLGLALIIIGLSRNGVRVPTPTVVAA